MPISVADIDARVGETLNDVDSIRWTLEERLNWINDAAAEIVLSRPAAGVRAEAVYLQEGSYHQIPSNGLLLLNVIRNLKQDGSPGRAVSLTDRSLLDSQDPGWYERKPAKAIKHYCFDDRDPKSFYSYPPAAGGTQVEILYSAPPELVYSLDDQLDLDRAYMGPVVSYTLYRALAKDAEYANGVLAAAHFEAFNAAIISRNEVSVVAGPKGAMNEGS